MVTIIEQVIVKTSYNFMEENRSSNSGIRLPPNPDAIPTLLEMDYSMHKIVMLGPQNLPTPMQSSGNY